MGVISCRSREGSVIPNYVRVKATSKRYCSNVGTENWGRPKGIPGCEKACFGYSESKASTLASSGDLHKHEKEDND